MLNAIHVYNYESETGDLYKIDSVLDTLISPLLGGFMCIWMAYRSYALARLAKARVRTFPFSFQLRAFLLCFMSFLYLIVVVFTSTTHFLIFDQDDPFALISSTLMMVIFIWEVVLLRFEFVRGVPFFVAHKIFWIVIFLIAASNFALDCVFFDEITIMHFIVDICKLSDMITLLIYSIFIKTQDLRETENMDIYNSTKLPLLAENIRDLLDGNDNKNQHKRTNAEEFSAIIDWNDRQQKPSQTQELKIQVEFKSKLIYQRNEAFYEIKISINGPEKNYKIWKSLKNFFDLEKNLLKDTQNKATLFSKSYEELVCFSHFLDKDGLQGSTLSNCAVIQILNEYINKLINKIELLNIHVILFLEIPEPYRKSFLQANNRYLQGLIETKNKKPKNLSNESCKTLNEISFDVFEMDFLQEYEEFITIGYNLLELPSEKWVITRKKSEIFEFIKKFQSKFLEESLFGSENFKERFRNLCNENWENFTNREFLEFLGVSERVANMIKIKSSDPEKRIMKELKIQIVDVMEIFDKEKNKESRYYNILVENEEKNEKKVVFFKNIHKKYRHFKELNSILLKKFHNFANELPVLPGKGMSCKSCEIREELELYLQKLTKFPYISHSLAFRRFLNVCFLKGSFIEEPFVQRQSKMTFCD